MFTMLLAVDGGGTKTYLLIAEKDGTIISDGEAGPLSLEVVTRDVAKNNFFDAFNFAIKKCNRKDLIFTKALIGLAGIDTQKELEEASNFFSTILYEQNCITQVVNDTIIALASGSLSQNAIILIAGTGSNCYGQNNLGEKAKAGGLGYLLSDEGSGYFIGDGILRGAIQSFDGRGPKTILEDMIKLRFQINDVIELKEKINVHNFQKTTISSLAIMLRQALDSNDKVAIEILNSAISELTKMVFAVANKLHFKDKQFDLVLAGSLFSTQLINFESFCQNIKTQFSQVNCILPKDPPAYGALKLLLQN